MTPRLPLHGEERLAAIRQLRRALADDMIGTALYLASGVDGEPWTAEAIGETVDSHAGYLHAIVDLAHTEAVGLLSWAGVIR